MTDTCVNGCFSPSIHHHIRKVDGKNQTIAYICFICRGEWWASKEFQERFGKPTDPYQENGKIVIPTKSVSKHKKRS